MKRISLTLTILLFTFSALTIDAYSQDENKRNQKWKHQSQTGGNFVDADGDGVCDNFIDADGDGVCDHCTGEGNGRRGRGMGHGRNFVDADGDGVCDNFIDADGDGVCDNCTGEGKGRRGRGMGHGGNFVDADGDGVCDNFVDEDGDGINDNCKSGKGNGRRCKRDNGDLDQFTFEVSQNYPNPFTNITQLNVNLKEKKEVVIKIYDYMGNQVDEIYNGTLDEGDNLINYSTNGLKPGLYFYQVTSNGKSITKQMMFEK